MGVGVDMVVAKVEDMVVEDTVAVSEEKVVAIVSIAVNLAISPEIVPSPARKKVVAKAMVVVVAKVASHPSAASTNKAIALLEIAAASVTNDPSLSCDQGARLSSHFSRNDLC